MQGNGGTIQVGSKSTLAWKNVSTPLQVDLSAQAEKTVVLGKCMATPSFAIYIIFHYLIMDS